MGQKESKVNEEDVHEYPSSSILKGSNESDAALTRRNNDSTASFSPQHKLTIWTGTVFIIGEMAGSGVLALPRAIENTGYIGLFVLFTCCFAVGWCGVLLGKCWIMLEERFPQYQDHCRDPYPSIGYEAFGCIGKWLVSGSIDLTLFGVSVIFIILASQNLHEVFSDVPALHFSPCLWMIIVAAVLTPVVWLGTPKDFWPVAVGATIATAVACIIIVVSIALHPTAKSADNVKHDDVDLMSFALAFGTILFSFGGAPAFPTIQHDMHNTGDFPKALFLGFGGMLLMYMPVAAVGYFLIGSTLTDNLLVVLGTNGGKNWMYYTTQALICSHLLFAFTIIINPVCQELEKILKIPSNFTWKRAVLRTLCVLLVLFVAESVPHFGPILSLIGGSTNTLLSIVFPCVFYLKLSSMENISWRPRPASLVEKIFSVEVILVGLLGGAVSTYSAIKALADPTVFSPACYINMTLAFQ